MLDDGETTTNPGSPDLWSFQVRPRWVCVTATAPGYHPGAECRHVPSDASVDASIALYPDSDFIDAGPTPDAGAGPDGAVGLLDDAGNFATSDGGGCGCHSADRAGASAWLLVFLVAREARKRICS
jgi:hypothetical protein